MNNLRLIIISIFVCGLLAIDSPNISSIENLKVQANILADNGDVNIALTVYLNILEQEESIYEPFDVKLAHTLNRIGELYISIGEEGISQVYIQRAITIYEYKIIETQKRGTCSNHPHNYYMEVLTDLGIVGLIVVIIIASMFLFYLFKNYRFLGKNNLQSLFLLAATISLFLEMFPIKSSGSIFTTNNATYIILVGSVILSHKKLLAVKNFK